MKDDLSRKLKGKIISDYPLGQRSWFRCGGTADILFQPKDLEDLQTLISIKPENVPVTIIGGLANTIVRDGGIRGVTIQLGKPFSEIEVLSDTDLRVGAGTLNGSVAAAAMKNNIGDLAFLSGVPGSIGGALAMNAGAYGKEIKDCLVSVTGIDASGNVQRFLKSELTLSYRHTDLPKNFVVTSVHLRGRACKYDIIRAHMNDIKTKRNDTQPIREMTGGSTFANPSAKNLYAANLPEGTRAWQIVENVEGRGLKIGGAQMSEKHCNFMINTSNATASDLEDLGDLLKKRALDKYGVDLLRWEIKRIGERI